MNKSAALVLLFSFLICHAEFVSGASPVDGRGENRISSLLNQLRTRGTFRTVPQGTQPSMPVIPPAVGVVPIPVAASVVTVPAPEKSLDPKITSATNLSKSSAIKDFWSRWPARKKKSIETGQVAAPESEKVVFHFSQDYNTDGSVREERRLGSLRSENFNYNRVAFREDRPDAEWLKRNSWKETDEVVISKVKDPYSPSLRSSSQGMDIDFQNKLWNH